jgi:hypothetical protein
MNSVLAPALEKLLAKDPEVALATARELLEHIPQSVLIDKLVDETALTNLLTAELREHPIELLTNLQVIAAPNGKAKAKAKVVAKVKAKAKAKVVAKPTKVTAKPIKAKPVAKPEAKIRIKLKPKAKDASKGKRLLLSQDQVVEMKRSIMRAISKHGQASRAQISGDVNIPSEAVWVRLINELVTTGYVKRQGTRRTATYQVAKKPKAE